MSYPSARAQALVALVERRLPVDCAATGDDDSWPLVGPALLAHAAGSLHSMFVLGDAGSHNDAGRLLRSLYDHVLTFAWLAAEPTAERLGAWRRADLETRLKADREMRSVGEEFLAPATRTQMERDVASLPDGLLDAAAMAIAVDRYWAPRNEFVRRGETTSFVGLYTLVFRHYSGLVHPTYIGLNRVVEDTGPHRQRVVMQAAVDGRGPYGLATAVLGLGLTVAASALGWPEQREIDDAFAI